MNIKCFFCWSCFSHFTSENILRNHQDYCYEHESVKTVIPEKNISIEFKNHIKTQWFPIVIYVDFESYLIPINTDLPEPDPSTSYTKKYQKHEPSGFSFYVKSFNEEVFKSELVEYTGEDVGAKFVEEIEKMAKKIYDIPEAKIIFTENDQEIFNKATECYICKEHFTNDFKNKKVRDHCHYTGKFRGAAHSICNLKHCKPNFIPVFFHNLTNYDSQLFIKSLGFTEGDINCIPNNEEKYISFTKKAVVDQYYDKKKQTKIKLLILGF